MSKQVRIRLPREGADRRRINLVAWLMGCLAVVAAVGTYFLVDWAMDRRASDARVVARYPDVLIVERGGQGRGQRILEIHRRENPFLALLGARDDEDYRDVDVVLRRARVIDVVGDRLFTVGPEPAESVLVHMTKEADDRASVRPGQIVEMQGRVKDMPEAETLRSWGLSEAETTRLGRRNVYVEAHSVDVVKP